MDSYPSDDGASLTRRARSVRGLLTMGSDFASRHSSDRLPDCERGEMKALAAFSGDAFDDGSDDASLSSFKSLSNLQSDPSKVRTSNFQRTPGGRVGEKKLEPAPVQAEESQSLPQTPNSGRWKNLKRMLSFRSVDEGSTKADSGDETGDNALRSNNLRHTRSERLDLLRRGHVAQLLRKSPKEI